MWTLPNLLTMARIVAVAPLVAFIAAGESAAAFAIFAAAALTDLLDGWIARRFDLGSEFGRFLDPLADKLVVAGALIALVSVSGAGTWRVLYPALAIIAREIAVAGLREYLGPKGVIVHVSALAKWKTATQMIAIALMIGADAVAQTRWGGTGRGSLPGTVGLALLDVSAVLAWASAWGYFRAALPAMRGR